MSISKIRDAIKWNEEIDAAVAKLVEKMSPEERKAWEVKEMMAKHSDGKSSWSDEDLAKLAKAAKAN
jgi:hypothetical protein